MKRAGSFIKEQCEAILEKKQRAVFCAALFSVMPFLTWASVALICLVTLRKGARSGFDLLLPALVIHSVPLMLLIPLSGALINTLITYLPCYFAALCLRNTQSWQLVMGMYLLQALLGCILIHFLAPNFIETQFSQFKILFAHYQELIDSSLDGLNSSILAQLFFGIQLLSVGISSVLSLIVARGMQAKLFLPGGFKKEVVAFRCGRLSLLVLLGVSIASYYEISIALNVLPLVLCYFLIAGFSLTYFIFSNKKQVRMFIVFMLLILLKPMFIVFLYIILGSLDSLVNFRSYLLPKVGESI